MSLPRNSPLGASAEHIYPLAEGGDLTPNIEDTRLSHLQCNREHGGRIGSQRAQQNRITDKNKNKIQLIFRNLCLIKLKL